MSGYFEGGSGGRGMGSRDVDLDLPGTAHGELDAGLVGAIGCRVNLGVIGSHIHSFHSTFQGDMRVAYGLLRVLHLNLHREGSRLGDEGRIRVDLEGDPIGACLSGLYLRSDTVGNKRSNNGTKPGHENEKSNAEGDHKQIPSHSHH